MKRGGRRCWILALLVVAGFVVADGNETDNTMVLSFRPSLTYSLPLQILITTIVCTILVVLLIHIAFTASHHYHLAPVNFIFQFSAATVFLVTHATMLIVILRAANNQTRQWPYMFSWVSVDIPPKMPPLWTTAQIIVWCVVKTMSSALVQVSHVHLLTLFYPSRFECFLLYCTLGPLVVISAVTQFLPLIPPVYPNYVHIAYATRMTCTAALAILFSSLLLVWSTPFFNSLPPESDATADTTSSTSPLPSRPSHSRSPSERTEPPVLKPLHPLAHLFLTSKPLPLRARSFTKLFSSQAWSRHTGTLTLALSTLSLSVINIAFSLFCVIHAAGPRTAVLDVHTDGEAEWRVLGLREAPWQLALVWAMTLWQTYLGWWWWIGAGGAVDGDENVKDEKRDRGLGSIRAAKAQFNKLGKRITRGRKIGRTRVVRRESEETGDGGEDEEEAREVLSSGSDRVARGDISPSPHHRQVQAVLHRR